ncbi:MAG: hypothetical protein AUJ70_01045 [Candidatus Omnitrophica bacterium CG1_02_40_15]|nr:MAG: hypothetical protein AUJ70_01045 [Candidatus Omnitrophica bacterium CG1_02_40_15]
MKIILKSSILLLLFVFLMSEIALAVTATVNPDPYTIIMKKARLRNSVTLEWVTVGEADLSVNIASVNAGELAAGYVSGSAIPEGTYDQIEVTLDRDMTVKASYTDSGNIFAGGAGTIYYTTSTAGVGGSIQASNSAASYTEGTCKVPSTVSGVDTTADTYTKTYNLPSTITAAKGSTQKVRVKFDVTGATTFEQTGAGTAVAYPTEPSVEMQIIN